MSEVTNTGLAQVRDGGDVVVVGADVVVDGCVVVVGLGVVVGGAAVVVGEVVVGAAVVVAGLGDGEGAVPPAALNIADMTRSRPSENLITAVIMCDPLTRVDTSNGPAVPSEFVPPKSKGT